MRTYGLLTKCEVNMAGYWPSSFFVCLWIETKLRSINSQKKQQSQYPAILIKQVWTITTGLKHRSRVIVLPMLEQP